MKTCARILFLPHGLLLVVVGLAVWAWPCLAANRVSSPTQVQPEVLAGPVIVGAGESVGIGVALGIDEGTKMPKVSKIFPGSPAAEAGLAEGDMIREINGVQTTGLALEQCVKMIRGDAGTIVTLEILRAEDGAAIVLKLKRRAFRLTDG
jgi:C-terminal processing protease CtpA/Prc